MSRGYRRTSRFLWKNLAVVLLLGVAMVGACTQERARSSDDDDDGGSSSTGGGAGGMNIPGIPAECNDLISCATQDGTVPLTPILEQYGENGTCYENFPEAACAQDCVAMTEGLSCPDESCIPAANGWPANKLPADYGGNGYAVGSQLPPWTGGIDQHGNSDVALGQFYGSMVLVSVGVLWAPPSLQAAVEGQQRRDSLNGDAQYDFWAIDVLVEGQEQGTPSTGADASFLAEQFGLSYPVLAGQLGTDVMAASGVQAFPTFFVLDPELRVREVIEGYPGSAQLTAAVASAWGAFIAENPDWQKPCP